MLSSFFGLACNWTKSGICKAELETTKDVQFRCNAVVLYRSVDSYLGNYIEVHERIKILLTKMATKVLLCVYSVSRNQKVEGATYNLVDGQIVKTELDKDLIFEDELIKDVEFKKFTFPNVSVGSVLEYHYKTGSTTTCLK